MNNLTEGAKLVGTEVGSGGNVVMTYQLPSEVRFVTIDGVLIFDNDEESKDDIT